MSWIEFEPLGDVSVKVLDEAGARTEAALRENPGLLAHFDQAVATEDESRRDLVAALDRVPNPRGFQTALTDDPKRASALAAELIRAALRLVCRRCEHATWPPTSKTFVSLACRAAVCDRPGCMIATYEVWEDDGLCEFCGEATENFYAVIGTAGFATISAELCPACFEQFK